MSKFENVTILRNANQYFGGQVTSRTLFFANGEKKTLGIMMPGEYRFDTHKKEVMEIQAGEVEVLLPGETVWQTVTDGESFEVPANAEFDIKVNAITDYCCSYID
jgi:purine/pyrimidine-nucleoside phosphorylase